MIPTDPIMMLSFINLKLRDYYSSLDALCEDLDEDKEMIVSTLKAAGFKYDENTNQFR